MYPTHSQPRACASSGLPRTAPSSSPHLSSLDYNLPRKEDFFLPIPTCPFGSRWYRSTLPSQTGQSDTQPSWAAWRFFVQWTEHSSCRFCEVGPVSPDECPGFRKSELGFSALVETWADLEGEAGGVGEGFRGIQWLPCGPGHLSPSTCGPLRTPPFG